MADRSWHMALGVLPQLDTNTWPEPWKTLLGTPLDILITVVLTIVVRWLAHRLVDRFATQAIERHETRLAVLSGAAGRFLADASGLSNERFQQRTATTATLLKSISTAILFTIGGLTVLQLVGLPLGPVLASAGVGGVALGIGAQSLVRDFLSGIFMIAEDQYGVGDVVDTGSVVGTVEEVTLRVTRLRDGDGVVWYLRNGEILRIGNRSQGWSVAVVDVQLGYGEDIARVTGVLSRAIEHLRDEQPWSDVLLDAPSVVGIESMAQGLVTLRVTAKTRANERDGVQRELRTRIKHALDEAGVRMPVPFPVAPTPAGS